jgi:hypothetical protein
MRGFLSSDHERIHLLTLCEEASILEANLIVLRRRQGRTNNVRLWVRINRALTAAERRTSRRYGAYLAFWEKTRK